MPPHPRFGQHRILAPGYLAEFPGLLVDWQIRELAEQGMIIPFYEGTSGNGVISYGLSSHGYDVRLGCEFMAVDVRSCGKIDPKKIDADVFYRVQVEEGEQVWIPAGGLILGHSVEHFKIPRNIGIECIGKSTYARCGITINVTPGEPEWEGVWTIEIENACPVPVCVYAGEGIFQCRFHRSVTECDTSYKDKRGQYQGDKTVQTAKVK